MIEVIVKSGRCPRPMNVAAAQLNDSIWALMEQSWKLDPSNRPSMKDMHLLLTSFIELAA